MIKRKKKRKKNPSNHYYLTKNGYDNSLMTAEGSENKIHRLQNEYSKTSLILSDENLDQLLAFLISQYVKGIGITDFVKEVIGESKLEKLRKYYQEYQTTNSQTFDYWLGRQIEEATPISADKMEKYLYDL